MFAYNGVALMGDAVRAVAGVRAGLTVASTLRNETRPEHVRTEAAFAGFDLSTHRGYALFLQAQASAFLAVERSLEVAGVGAVIDDWADRRRSALLRADLAELEVGDVTLQPPPSFDCDAHLVGGVYVLEGSRLGGKLLRTQVPSNAPVRFLSAAGEPGSWRTFLHSLDHRLSGPSDIRLAVEAARRVFHSFEQAGRETVERCVAR